MARPSNLVGIAWRKWPADVAALVGSARVRKPGEYDGAIDRVVSRVLRGLREVERLPDGAMPRLPECALCPGGDDSEPSR